MTARNNTYAVLGATGNCGSALIQHLLQKPDAHINAYCRSKTKLLKRLDISENEDRVEVFEGSLEDTALLRRCIYGRRAVFLCVATNDNVPGTSLSLDTAKAVVQALRSPTGKDRKGTASKTPKLVLLSSGTIDENFSRGVPRLLLPILLRSESYVYDDLTRSEKFLRSQEDWITSIFMKPGALAVDRQRGHALSLTHSDGPTSYLDLAAAMIEAVNEPSGLYDMRSVSTVCTNGAADFPSGTPWCIFTGLLRHFFPWLHPYLPLGTGPK